MTHTQIAVKKVLDSMGGWENIKLCMDAEKFEVDEGYNRITIWYWKGGTRQRINIYGDIGYEGVNPAVRVYFISPNYPCSIDCNGTINKPLIAVIREITGLSLDLL